MTDHKQAALKALNDIEHTADNNLPEDWVGASGNEQFMVMATFAEAQVHAALYLAEQQRIANLIALLEANHPIGDNGYDGLARFTVDKETGQQKSLLLPEIRAALGLDG